LIGRQQPDGALIQLREAVRHPVRERHEPAADERGGACEEADHHEKAADELDRPAVQMMNAGGSCGMAASAATRRPSASRATGRGSRHDAHERVDLGLVLADESHGRVLD
jgi:hypothetical protein